VANVRVSAGAKADLSEILATSLERWGEDGRVRYRSLLVAAMHELGANPERLMTKDCGDLLPGLRSYHVRHVGRDHGVKTPVHVIYYRRAYRKARSSIVIVRVLHERMAPRVHLIAATPRARRPPRK
jgi:toxin ParE1/3/4